MSSEVGTAYVTLIPSAKGFAARMQSELGGDIARAGSKGGEDYGRGFADTGSKTIGGRAKGMFSGLAKGGLIAAAAAGAAIGKVLWGSVGEARDAAVVGARTENVIRSMGNSANVSAKQVADLAAALSNKAGVDDEAIQSGQNLLLTFGNVRNEVGKGNDIFNQTSALMVDMSRAMGTDMKGSAIQLGKALNDPIKGVSALSRVGVSFSKQQKDQIKKLTESGDMLGAQKIILGEVEKQFGGAAKAMATPADRAKVSWGNFQEEIGARLLPVVDRVLTAMADGLPKVIGYGESLGRIFRTKVAPAFSAAKDFVTDLFSGSGSGQMSSWIGTFKGVFADVQDIVRTASGIIVALWENGTIGRVVEILKSAASAIIGILSGAFRIVRGIFNVVAGLLTGDWSRVWDGIKQILSGAWKIIVSLVKHLWTMIRVGFQHGGALVKGIMSRAWALIKMAVAAGVRFVVAQVRAVPGRFRAALGAVGGVLKAVFSAAFNGAKSLIGKAASGIITLVRSIPGRLRSLGSKFLSAGKDLIGAFIRGIGRAGGVAADFAGQIWSAVKSAINAGIRSLNSLLEFDFKVKGVGFTVNAPDIPQLATGGRATGGTLAVIGEGSEPETVLPDSVLAGFMERMTAAATANLGGGRSELTITNWDEGVGFIEDVAGGVVDDAAALADEGRRAR